jgi:hypothetical protein
MKVLYQNNNKTNNVKKLLLLLLALTMLSLADHRDTPNLRKRTRDSDAQGMSDSDKGYTTYSATYKSDGNLVRNIGGSIIQSSKQTIKGCFFYIHLDNNKEVRWGTSRKYDAKDIGDRVFFDYIGKYRFKTNILNR